MKSKVIPPEKTLSIHTSSQGLASKMNIIFIQTINNKLNNTILYWQENWKGTSQRMNGKKHEHVYKYIRNIGENVYKWQKICKSI